MPPNTTITPNACMLAILFVTFSTSGPSLAFHYPLRPRFDVPPVVPRHAPSAAATDYGGTSTSDSSSDESSVDEVDADGDERDTTTSISRRRSKRDVVDVDDDNGVHAPSDIDDGAQAKKKRTEGYGAGAVLGFKPEFLAGLLAPKTWAAGRFEMTVDDMVFLGAPVYVRPDGTWRKRKKRRRWRNGGSGLREGEGEVERGAEEGEEDADDEAEDGARKGKLDNAEEGDGMQENGGMSMFHVVFVLNPPELEYQFRTDELFDYVVKRFSRALKYEQAKDGYVWREAEKISRLKEQMPQKDGELWKHILDKSNLAYAISRVYIDISQSRISHVLLNNSLGLSLQLPIVSDISVLPSLTDPQVRGLPLTSAVSFGDDETKADALLVRHFTLLFLEDVDSILKDISAESTESSASLAHFVKNCKPTHSFLHLSNQTGVLLAEIQVLARHLIHWRKARAIPPIHQRDTYIVNPNADMKRLPQLIPLYARQFPTLPALPKLLALLSAKPKPYATFIPTRDHRSAYLEILAWLLRYGLATQLRNFAWIRIPSSIKLAVHRERLLKRASASSNNNSEPGSPVPDAMVNSNPSLLSNGLRADLEGAEDLCEAPDFEDSFILEPFRPNGVESAWLEMVVRNQPPDVKALWERFLKYLNGQHAIEKIAVREGVPMKDVRKVFVAMEEVVVYARHW